MTETTATKAVAVGDVFYASWGYDQTNVDWFVVSKLSASGKTATFTHVLGSIVESSEQADRVAANLAAAQCKNCYRAIRQLRKASGETLWRHTATGQAECYASRVYGIGVPDSWQVREGRPECTAAPDTFTARLKYYSDRACANWKSYASVYAWDGASKYQTAAGWGH